MSVNDVIAKLKRKAANYSKATQQNNRTDSVAATTLRLKKEAALHYRRIGAENHLDASFARPDDEPLTKEEIAAIDAYWGKYKFAYPKIDYKSFQTFKNRYGHLDVRHCPGSVRKSIFFPHFVNRQYMGSFQNKGLMDYLYPDFKKPRTIYRRLDGIFFDEQFNIVSVDEVAEGCCEYIHTVGNLIVKSNGTSGGKGVCILNESSADPRYLKKLFKNDYAGYGLVIQDVLKQSSFMEALNPSSVNTIRITTLLFKEKVTPLAAVVRIGSFGSEVDNWCSGGSLLGVDIKTGKCNDWALSNDLRHVSTLPSGMDVSAQELYVPNFDLIKEQAIRAHCRIPYIKMISWDIALDQDDTPTFIECNFAGMIQLHEATTGALFGELMDELCDEYMLNQFFLRTVKDDFICKQYHDRLVPERYIGKDSTKRGHLVTVDGKEYYTNPKDGRVMKECFVTVDGNKYYLSAKDGHKMKGGLLAFKGQEYYLSAEDGRVMTNGWVKGNGGKRYKVDQDGVVIEKRGV